MQGAWAQRDAGTAVNFHWDAKQELRKLREEKPPCPRPMHCRYWESCFDLTKLHFGSIQGIRFITRFCKYVEGRLLDPNDTGSAKLCAEDESRYVGTTGRLVEHLRRQSRQTCQNRHTERANWPLIWLVSLRTLRVWWRQRADAVLQAWALWWALILVSLSFGVRIV